MGMQNKKPRSVGLRITTFLDPVITGHWRVYGILTIISPPEVRIDEHNED
jgi:hypothetical protein